MKTAPGTRTRRRVPVVLIAAALVIAFVAMSDRGRARTDPLEECADYAAALRRCFGERASITAPPPPKTDSDREAARKRCIADRARIERACR
jgi:hypothetical protein